MEPIIMEKPIFKLKEILHYYEGFLEDYHFDFIVVPKEPDDVLNDIMDLKCLDGYRYMIIREYYVNRIDFIELKSSVKYKCRIIFTLSNKNSRRFI